MKSLYLDWPPPLVFKWSFGHFGQAAAACGRVCKRENAMPNPADHRDPGALSARLHAAPETNATLMAEISGTVCRRFPSPGQSEKTARIEHLIRSEAWTEAALALIDFELPLWQIRRLAYDGGEWYCALSRQRELPEWLDQSIETCHAVLSLAILGAFVEAKRISAPSSRPSVPVVKGNLSPLYAPVCCDNFA